MPLPNQSSPIAVLTASFGDGHNSAARGIAQALELKGLQPTGPIDLLQRIHPAAMSLASSGYRTAITRWPWIWRRLYSLADGLEMGDGSPDFTPQITRGMANFLKSVDPSVVISTYPLYAHLLERLFGRQPLPFGLLTMVTDSTTINRAWLNQANGHYAVTDSTSSEFFLKAGVAPGRVHVTGFPVDPAFGTGAIEEPPTTLPTPFRILYTPSTKKRHVHMNLAAIDEARARHPGGTELTVVLGRHEKRLRHAIAAGPGVRVLGWTDRMPELLRDHHLLIGKAGGASVQEAMAAGCPMLVDHIVPGQEEGNAELLESLGTGARAEDPAELGRRLSGLLADAGAGWLEMRGATARHGRPTAANAVADLAIQLATEAERPVL